MEYGELFYTGHAHLSVPSVHFQVFDGFPGCCPANLRFFQGQRHILQLPVGLALLFPLHSRIQVSIDLVYPGISDSPNNLSLFLIIISFSAAQQYDHVILIERSESKDLGTDSTANVAESAKFPPRSFALVGMTRSLHCASSVLLTIDNTHKRRLCLLNYIWSRPCPDRQRKMPAP